MLREKGKMTNIRIVQSPEIELRLSLEDGFSVLSALSQFGDGTKDIEDQLRTALNMAATAQRNDTGYLNARVACRFPGCGRTFTSLHGRGTHETRAHKGWEPTQAERITEDVHQ